MVLPGARDDQGRNGQPERVARLDGTFSAIEEALSFQFQDWGTESARFRWSRNRSDVIEQILAGIPGDLDRSLVAESYDRGVDVFLTIDKQLLRSTAKRPSVFSKRLAPADTIFEISAE